MIFLPVWPPNICLLATPLSETITPSSLSLRSVPCGLLKISPKERCSFFFNHNNNTSKSELSVICKVLACRSTNTQCQHLPPIPTISRFCFSIFILSLSALDWTEVFCSEVNKQQAVLIFSKSLIIVSALPGQY